MALEKPLPENDELPKVARLLEEAQSLSAPSRAILITALQDSIDPDDSWDDAFIAELDRRANAIDAGEPTYSLEEVAASLRASR